MTEKHEMESTEIDEQAMRECVNSLQQVLSNHPIDPQIALTITIVGQIITMAPLDKAAQLRIARGMYQQVRNMINSAEVRMEFVDANSRAVH